MRTKIILCLLILSYLLPNILLSEELEGNCDGDVEFDWNNFERMLYRGQYEFTDRRIQTSSNDTNYLIKIMCYSGLPYMGKVYLDTLQPAIREVNYWDREYIVETTNYLKRTSEKLSYVINIKISKFNITFDEAKKVNMYIVDALTGDTVVSHSFPKPPTRMDTLLIGYKATDTLNEARFRKMYAEAIVNGDYVEWEKPLATSSLDYVLPQGTYFVYFINTDDRKLRWAEQITINE
jgi:hypothetical protein